MIGLRNYLPVLGLLLSGMVLLATGGGCSDAERANERLISFAAGGRVKTLDPALADDLASRNMVGALFDTLLEYDYMARPYRLQPGMLAEMPQVNATHTEYTFTLRDDLFFPIGGRTRKIKSEDVIYSLKRLADSRLHSPAYWMIRGKIVGLNEFYAASLGCAAGKCDLYDLPVAGMTVLDDRRFRIKLVRPDSRFLYILALPNSAVVPREAVELYGADFAFRPVGSGPFILKKWIRDYRLELVRNADFRRQYFSAAVNPADRRRPLPLADRIICYQVRQPFAAWLLFLQGELDASVLDKDNMDMVSGGGGVVPALARRGVKLMQSPEFEIRYIGFNFRDPLLRNEKLRQAVSLAFNVKDRIRHMNNLMFMVHGPVPPGVDGYDAGLKNEWLSHDLARAKKLLAEAGYPDGINPATGEALTLDFDQGNNTAAQRQLGELMARDLAELGIKTNIILNSTPRFIDKLRSGKTQLFRYSWVGDYPDAENFLQLFYSGNIGGCNRAAFSDAKFDRMYERAAKLGDSPERTALYKDMSAYLIGRTPWIFEGIPLSFQLTYDWLENYYPHDFLFCRWKYVNVRPQERAARRAKFTPLDFSELRK